MSKIPTAESFTDKYRWRDKLVENMNVEEFDEAIRCGLLNKLMVGFAKLHVKAALEAAADNVKWYAISEFAADRLNSKDCAVDKESILIAYPETNIK